MAELAKLRREMADLDARRGQPDLLELGDLETQVTPFPIHWTCGGVVCQEGGHAREYPTQVASGIS